MFRSVVLSRSNGFRHAVLCRIKHSYSCRASSAKLDPRDIFIVLDFMCAYAHTRRCPWDVLCFYDDGLRQARIRRGSRTKVVGHCRCIEFSEKPKVSNPTKQKECEFRPRSERPMTTPVSYSQSETTKLFLLEGCMIVSWFFGFPFVQKKLFF
jgi:hypothetical protein